MSKFSKLRRKLQEAEERGFKTALDLMGTFVEHRMDIELTHRPDTNIHKRTITETYTQVKNKINELRHAAN